MDAYNLPQLCRENGLSCQECTDTSAKNLARICNGLQGTAVNQIFAQMYPHKACAPMSTHFCESYDQTQSDAPARRTAMSAGVPSILAVA